MKLARRPPLFLASWLVGLSLLAGCTSAPPAPRPLALPTANPNTAPLDLTAPLPFDATLTRGKLDNGLTYYIKPHKAPVGRAELWLVINAGSVLEDESQRGLAHFLEHMAFNGTRRFEKMALVDYLESVGMEFGPDINASTSFDETLYTLRVPTDPPEIVDRALDILEDWACCITFDPVEVDKERGVILEEWRLGRDASARVVERQAPVFLRGSRYAERMPIGELAVIEKAPAEALRQFHRDWYRPDLMAVIAVGDIDPVAIEAKIRERFSRLPAPTAPRPREFFAVPGHDETLISREVDAELTDTTVAVYTKLPRRNEGALVDYRRTLVENLAHTMLNDRLYELAHMPDPPLIGAGVSTSTLVRTAEVAEAAARVREGQVERGLRTLLEEIERVHRHGFTAGELERAKRNVQRTYEDALTEFETYSARALAAEYSRNFLENEPVPGIPAEVELIRQMLPTVTLADVQKAVADVAADANRVILISAPSTDGLPDDAKLLALFGEVEQQTLSAYVDIVPTGALLEKLPRKGRVVERRAIPELGVTIWKLSNGAEVVLKPTDFKKDQVLFEATSPGGLSQVDDDEFWSGAFAADLVAGGGLGDISQIDVDKMLAGREVGLRPWIDDGQEGLNGAASAGELETLFQMVYLRFTAPRFSPDAFYTYRDKVRPLLEKRLADPETAFREKLTQVLSQGHPRAQPLTPESLDQVDPHTALQIYRDRFADASDFSFFLVGSFDVAALEPLVERYLAALPSLGRKEQERDRGVRRPTQPTRFEVFRGREPKAEVALALAGDAAFSRQALTDIDTLASAFEIRLREVLREDLGAVYTVGVSGSLQAKPVDQFALSIRFGCAPERADALIATIRREAEAFRRGEIDPLLAAKVREARVRQRQLALRQNRFWLDILTGYKRLEIDPKVVLEFESLMASVTPERLAESARKFLDLDRAVVGVLRPEPEAAAAPAVND